MSQGDSVGEEPNGAARAYYAAPGPLTDLSRYNAQIGELPTAIGDLCRVVQGLVVHPFLGHLYGLQPNEVRLAELETRTASDMMARILELDSRPLAEARPPQSRFVGNCRHFTVLLCALLRARGLPARGRCGFGVYFDRSTFVDHWVCEVWNEPRGSWHLIDAQLEAVQRAALRIQFDPLDVPRSEFVVAGQAWQRCRSGRADADSFGILDLRGLWFVRGNLVRDLAAFAKRELLPWDGWGIMATRDDGDAAEMALLDRVAELTLAGDDRHTERLELQRSHPGLRVPPSVLSFNLGGAPVSLDPGIAN
jgi:transglutaminase superfamily protein